VLAGALLGFGFLTKMLQAFLVLPGFALVYLVAGPPGLGRRIWQLLAGGAALVVAAGWWVAIVQLTPAADRPYIGGSTSNSVLQLALGYNGLGRLDGQETGSVGFGGASGGAARGGGGGGGGAAFGGGTGLTRLFASEMGGQISWLLPAALISLVVLVWLTWRRPRTDRLRAAALLWGGWLLVTGLVFSYMAGIIHPYYTVALTPAIAALVGIGAVTAWRARRGLLVRAGLAASVLVTVAWADVLLDRTPDWLPWLRVVIVACGVAAAAVIIAEHWLGGPGRVVLGSVLPLALVAGLAGPLACSLDTMAAAHTGALPSAGPAVAGVFGGPGGAVGSGGPGTGAGPSTGTGNSTGTGHGGTGSPGMPGASGGTGPAGGEGIKNVTRISNLDTIRALLTFTDPKQFLFFTRTPNGRRAGQEFLARLKERTRDRDKKISLRSYAAQLKAIHRWGLAQPSDLSVIHQPVLVANGDSDKMVPTKNSADLARRLPGSELVIYPDAGHGGIFQFHAQFARKALEFLGR
jgi:hypothetical protein